MTLTSPATSARQPEGREAEARGAEGDRASDLRIVVSVFADGGLGVDFQPLEILLHDEVNDTGNGVRTIDRRSAAGENLDPLDQGRGDEVNVRRDENGVAGLQALAVDQNEGAARAEAPQVDRRGSGGAVGQILALASENLRQVVDEVFDVDRALKLDLAVVDRGDRADAGQVPGGDARPGDHNFVDGGVGAGDGGGSRSGGVGHAARSKGEAGDHG